jgi:hypothetical protein
MDISGKLNLKDNLIIRPEIIDYSETVNALGNVTGTTTIDMVLGNIVTATTTGITDWVFSNPSASGKSCSIVLYLTNGGSASQIWPSPNTKWASGTPPTLTVSGTDILIFVTIDTGTTWRGIVSCLDSK